MAICVCGGAGAATHGGIVQKKPTKNWTVRAVPTRPGYASSVTLPQQRRREQMKPSHVSSACCGPKDFGAAAGCAKADRMHGQ